MLCLTVCYAKQAAVKLSKCLLGMASSRADQTAARYAKLRQKKMLGAPIGGVFKYRESLSEVASQQPPFWFFGLAGMVCFVG